MKIHNLRILVVALTTSAIMSSAVPVCAFEWQVVANNGDVMPTDQCDPAVPNSAASTCRNFNSFNQPSVNASGLVVFRARSKGESGQGQPVHGIYMRDMSVAASPVVKILDRNTRVPQPNNRDTQFIEAPSFPRIDIWSDTVATRGNHQPVWKVSENGETIEQLGTTGIYSNPFGSLITGISKLGEIPEFSYFEVPELPGTSFDVFPGSPAVTDGNTIVFKGNYTANLASKTGVYYRALHNQDINGGEGGGTNPVVLIANNANTLIPGRSTIFGSTAPPSAAAGKVAFAGFDSEENPTMGGIYLARLIGSEPPLSTLVSIGSQVPGENRNTKFNRLGESVSFDGRFVAFWGAWGKAIKTLVLQCPGEGNADRVAFCKQLCTENPNNCVRTVPLKQGIFVHDTQTRNTVAVAKTMTEFDDFVYWSFSGRVPGTGEGDDDGELARWRSNSFVAVSGLVDETLADATFHTAFKARTGQLLAGAYVHPVDGIYLRKGPGHSPITAVVETGDDSALIDPEAVYVDDKDTSASAVSLLVTELGIERDGFRGNKIAVNLSMGNEDAGWAGVYLIEWR